MPETSYSKSVQISGIREPKGLRELAIYTMLGLEASLFFLGERQPKERCSTNIMVNWITSTH